MGSMNWTEHAIFWHVYPLGFTGAPIREHPGEPQSRLRALIDWLDYAVELGANGLLLGPIFDSTTHGYDTVDPFAIDPRLGTEQDFLALVAECKKRGIRIVLDGVFSHVGSQHPQFLTDLAAGDSEMFAIDFSGESPVPEVFEGHGDLVRFDHSSPVAQGYVERVMRYWLGRGIDGWRLDAAYSIPSSFWAGILPGLKRDFPEAWIFGEVIHGDYSQIVKESGIDSVTQYELWKAIWSSMKDKNFFELDHALGRHNEFLDTFVPQTFIGNHDVSRIATVVGQHGAIVALAVLATVGGVPSIYYGDEQGFTGEKEQRIGGDDAVRPAFPASPAQLSTLGQDVYEAHQDLLGLRRRHPWLYSARTESVHVENERFIYQVSSGDNSLEVELDIVDQPRAKIYSNNGEILWQLP